MVGEVVQTARGSYVRCAPDSGVIRNEADLLDLMGACYETEANRIMVESSHLLPEFFDLSTGMAGSFFLKLTTYQMQTAVVADLSAIKSQRFQELISESNKYGQIRYFNTAAEAEDWLLA